MTDLGLLPSTGFAGLAKPGRFGQGSRPVQLQERVDFRMVQIVPRRGREQDLAGLIAAETGLVLPAGPKRVEKDGLALIGVAPGQWQLLASTLAAAAALDRLLDRCADYAAIAEIGDGKAILRVSGRATREVLAKGCSLDLHPTVFAPGDAARTSIALIPCQIWQLDDKPSYEIAVDTSYAASFWRWITLSASESGFEVSPASSE